MDALKESLSATEPCVDMIEVSYDLQAGSYTEIAQTPGGRNRIECFAEEVAGIIHQHVDDIGSLLDVGTGEGTTFGPILDALGGCTLGWGNRYLNKSRALGTQES